MLPEDKKDWKASERFYKENKVKMHLTIWTKCCTMTKQMKLKQQTDHEKICHDPIELVLKVRNLAQTHEKVVYPMAPFFGEIRAR